MSFHFLCLAETTDSDKVDKQECEHPTLDLGETVDNQFEQQHHTYANTLTGSNVLGCMHLKLFLTSYLPI